MEFLVNDLSLEGQYPNVQAFQTAMGRLMIMKESVKKFGGELFCHRKIASAQVTAAMSFPQVIKTFDRNKRYSIMQWLTQTGPFWEDVRRHSPDDYLMYRDEIVTDSAVGEAAWCCIHGIEQHLVSFSPSRWEVTPLHVDFFENEELKQNISVDNFWEPITFEAVLEKQPVSLDSWGQLREIVVPRFTHLFFSEDAFTPLDGHPFVHGASRRLMVLFHILNRFVACHDANGKRTAEGNNIYQNFFTGKKEGGGRGAAFTDSKDNKKFKKEMTFKHPQDAGKNLFCPWHGKVQTPQIRIHFSWPVKAGEPVYIVYVGPKITKR